MLSLAFIVCASSIFVGCGVEMLLNYKSEEKEETRMFKKYQFYKAMGLPGKPDGHADKEWLKQMVMEDMKHNVDDILDILRGLGEDPNMLLGNAKKLPLPHNVFAYASYLVINNINDASNYRELHKRKGCNTELIQQLKDRGGDSEAKEVSSNGWFSSSDITKSAQDLTASFIDNKDKEKRSCAKKLNRLFHKTNELTDAELEELTDEELARQDYAEYLKKHKIEKDKE